MNATTYVGEAPAAEPTALTLKNLRAALRERRKAEAAYGYALYSPDFRRSQEEREQHFADCRARIETARSVVDGLVGVLIVQIEETL